MRLKIIAATAIAAMVEASAIACDGPPVCTVKDPTTTDLNVRAGPNGRILTTLRDGQQVEIIEHQEVGGKLWAKVAKFEYVEPGWVFGNYLKCKPVAGEDAQLCTVKDPTGTPLNIRATAAGEIVGQVRNGVRVRVLERGMHNGKPWVLVERWPDDNVVGWVFDPYLSCEEDAEGGH